MVSQVQAEGGRFTMWVKAVNLYRVAGYQMEVHFSQDLVKVGSVDDRGEFMSGRYPSYWAGPVVDNLGGKVTKLVCVRTDGGASSGSGKMFAVLFGVLNPGVASVRLENVLLIDPEGREIPVNIRNATIRIHARPPWDVNRDGRIDILDLLIVALWYGKSISWVDISHGNPDVNGDGVVNLADLILVGRHFGEGSSGMAPSKRGLDPEQMVLLGRAYRWMIEGEVDESALGTVERVLEGYLASLKLTTWGNVRRSK